MTLVLEKHHSGSATFSKDRVYRYALERVLLYLTLQPWQPSFKFTLCTFIMLNPSTADASRNDPTVTRCIMRAQDLNAMQLTVLNLFALRSTDPLALYASTDPVGPDNDDMIRHVCRASDIIVCAWGTHGRLKGREQHVLSLLDEIGAGPRLRVLGLNKDGTPKHPLYVPAAVSLIPWNRSKSA